MAEENSAVKNAAKSVAKNAAKKAGKALFKAFMATPYGKAIVFGIAILGLIIIIFMVAGGAAGSGQSETEQEIISGTTEEEVINKQQQIIEIQNRTLFNHELVETWDKSNYNWQEINPRYIQMTVLYSIRILEVELNKKFEANYLVDSKIKKLIDDLIKEAKAIDASYDPNVENHYGLLYKLASSNAVRSYLESEAGEINISDFLEDIATSSEDTVEAYAEIAIDETDELNFFYQEYYDIKATNLNNFKEENPLLFNADGTEIILSPSTILDDSAISKTEIVDTTFNELNKKNAAKRMFDILYKEKEALLVYAPNYLDKSTSEAGYYVVVGFTIDGNFIFYNKNNPVEPITAPYSEFVLNINRLWSIK